METLILLTYSGICWVIFKVFKVPVNKWTLTTAVMGGALLISSLVVLMNYNHPYTSNSRTYFVSTPIITNVSSVVNEVHVDEETLVSKGDTLFTLDSTVFKAKVQELKSEWDLVQTRLAQSRELYKYQSGNKYDVQYYETQLESIKAKYADYNWRVKQCVVTAPEDGLIVQPRLRKGMIAVEFPLKPLMTFVDVKNQYLVGAYPQNPLQRIKEGDEAEVTFDAIPGKVFQGKVLRINSVTAFGEAQAAGKLMDLDAKVHHGLVPQGSIPVFVELEEDMSEYVLPGGAKAQMAIYSEYMEPVKVVRKILLRMKGWLNYLFGEH